MIDLEHLHRVILEIIKDIDKLCQAYEIQYYLLGGSCIGAIRHKGFIPWDDDLDIIMTPENYSRFVEICKTRLDMNKYVFQEGLVDWPLNFSKLRLKGTVLHEMEDDYADKNMHGIYVDIFCLDNVADNDFLAKIQYVFAKYYLCYQLASRGYKNTTFKKKILMVLSSPLRIGFVRRFVVKQATKYEKVQTSRYGFFYGRTRFKTAITPKYIYGTPKYVQFEDTWLPVPEHYHEYLTQMFGDYMQLPPAEQQKGLHLISVDFGEY